MEMGKQKKKFQSLTALLVIIIVGLTFLMELSSGWVAYRQFTNAAKVQYNEHAKTLAMVAANIVKTEKLQTYLETYRKDAEYIQTERRLRELASASRSMYIYVATVDLKEGRRHIVYNVAGNVNREEKDSVYPMGHTIGIRDNQKDIYRDLLEGKRQYHVMEPAMDWFGRNYITALVPLYDPQWNVVAICGVVMSMDPLARTIITYFKETILLGILWIFAFVSLWILLIRKSVISPVKTIVKETERFAQERTIPEVPISHYVADNNELGELAQSIDNMESSIVTNVQERLRIAEEESQLRGELDVAAKIQMSALPDLTASFPGRREIDICGIMNPAKEVGGDFYDVFSLDEDHLAFVIADVSDKGVPSALFMMVAQLLIQTTYQHNPKSDPGQILSRVNNALCEKNHNDMFVTVWLGVLQLSTGQMRTANAGHEYPIVGNQLEGYHLLKDRHGLVLGGMEDIQYKVQEWNMQKGDVLFVYTDGLPEAINAKQEQYGLERALTSLQSGKSDEPEGIINHVLQDLSDFVGDVEQFDDTTILCLRYNGVSEE